MKYQDCVMDIFGKVILIPTVCAYLTDKHGDMSTPWFWTRIGVYVSGIIHNVIILLSPAPDIITGRILVVMVPSANYIGSGGSTHACSRT